MAYTKIHPIKTTLKKAIDYITNGEKTDEKILVSSFACTPETAHSEFELTRRKYNFSGENLAYHFIQSFKPDEVTPEQAHGIGIQTADEFLKGKYEYVISTHIDRGYVHNHIIINSVNFQNGLSFSTEHDRKNNPAWKMLRKISDEICLENKLSVIEMPEKGYGKCYYEWLQDSRNNSYKSKLKNAIDECIMTAESFEDFLEKMKNEQKYECIIRGKSLSFKAEEQERFTRCSRRNFGWYYEPEQIKKRIERQVKKRSASVLYSGDFYQVNGKNSEGLKRWDALKNMQEALRLVDVLSDLKMDSVAELEEKISTEYDRRFDVVKSLNDYEKDIIKQRELLKTLNTYWDTKTVHDEFLKCSDKKKFRKNHSDEFSAFESSKKWLKEKYSGNSLPNRSVLEMKITETESKREILLNEYHNLKKNIKKLENLHKKIENYHTIRIEEKYSKKNKGGLE